MRSLCHRSNLRLPKKRALCGGGDAKLRLETRGKFELKLVRVLVLVVVDYS
jgi:hypothetical protein